MEWWFAGIWITLGLSTFVVATIDFRRKGGNDWEEFKEEGFPWFIAVLVILGPIPLAMWIGFQIRAAWERLRGRA